MSDLIFKDGVLLRWGHFRDHVRLILSVALEMAPKTRGDVIVCTSAADGKHMTGSKHYSDEAFDLRVQSSDLLRVGNVLGEGDTDRVAIGKAWADRMRAKLGAEYDVVFEERRTWGAAGDSVLIAWIHGEYDPKGGNDGAAT
jgi:hypothetical protein